MYNIRTVEDQNPVKPQSMSPLSAFAERPGGVRFETQESKESVELFLRQHPIVNLGWLTTAAILLAVPYFALPILLRMLNITQYVPMGYIIVASAFWYLATFGFILTNFIHWFFNIYIVTNERIVDIDFYYLLYKHFSEADLSKIQDISYTSSGILPTMLDFGNVYIQTAAETPVLEFDKIPHPERVVQTIRMIRERGGAT